MQKPNATTTNLKRALGLRQLIFYGVGTILGLGIYILLGKVAGEAGMHAPLAFLIAAILASFTGFSYGELAARIPKSAGEVNYVDEAFNIKRFSQLIGWLIVISAMISTATVVNGYVGYVKVFVDLPSWAIISALTILLGSVAIKGINESVVLISIITIIEFSGLLLVIFVSGDHLAEIPSRFNELIPSSFLDWKGIFGGAFLAFFAFIGFEDMVNLAEESKEPSKDIPKAIVVSIIILTVLYIIIALIGAMAMSPQELDQSEAPLADILKTKGSAYPMIISFIGLIAIVNGVLVQILMGSRVLYGMASKNMAPSIFRIISSSTRTPIWSTVFMVAVILILALSFNLKSLAEATNYVLLFVFSAVNLSLWRIKTKSPDPKGIHTIPKWVPILGGIFSLLVLLIQIISELG